MTIIFTYNRFSMLNSLLNELKGEGITVIDDGSDYDPTPLLDRCEYLRFPHQGKQGFYKLWDYALKICKKSNDTWFMFSPDDITDIQLDKIKDVTKYLSVFAFNYVNAGKDRGWTDVQWKDTIINGVECYEMGYVDGVFVTDRTTLELLDFTVHPVPQSRFVIPNISSGCGQQLSKRLAGLNVPMYLSKKSLAYHGDHESVMHPDERLKHPLISV